MFRTLTEPRSERMTEDGRLISRINLKPIAKVWVKFLKSQLMLTTHTTIVLQERLILLYAIVKGLVIDVGKDIEREIRDYAMKKQKYVALLFTSLIMGICEVSGVQFKDSDERIKNEGAIIVRTIERIAGASAAAATPKHPATSRTEYTIRIENMFQALSKAASACAQAQVEENKRFLTYLQHLEAQKHQFTFSIESKNADFPDSLWQQF